MNEDRRRTVQTAYRAIALGHIEEMLNLCLSDATLTWGPFEFKGKVEIQKWAKELLTLFFSFNFIEVNLSISENEVKHNFLIETINKDMSKGLIPATGTYHFEGEKFKTLVINLGPGRVFYKSSELDRWREELKRAGLR